MKNHEILNRFILAMIGLNVCLILLWVTFYALTLRVIRANLEQQAETVSDTIITNMERSLLALENAAYDLAHDPSVIRMETARDVRSFFDCGSELGGGKGVLNVGFGDIDNVIIFRSAEVFYRLKGTVSNTTLRRVWYLAENKDSTSITVTSNGNTYIGTCSAILVDGEELGYVALLQEQSRIDRQLGAYNDLDYLGVALYSGDQLLSTNREQAGKPEELRGRAVFVREKEIGLSGYHLIVWGEDSISEWLSGYFRVAMPVTVLILILILLAFIYYLRKYMVQPIELEKERTLITLLKKQISAHFTVNSLNVVRALVNKGEKEEAAHICDELSILLRYANAGDEYISLLQEFYVLEQYIGIMRIRYPNRIEARIEEDDLFETVLIPRMLIQPIVENAIIHGLSSSRGWVSLSARIEQDAVIVVVADNGRGMEEKKRRELEEAIRQADLKLLDDLDHIALQNIERRIRLVCGPGYGLSIRSAAGEGSEVSVKLPLRRASDHINQ